MTVSESVLETEASNSQGMHYSLMIKKVLISTFFCVCVFFTKTVIANESGGSSPSVNCPGSSKAETAFVHHIIDGDTLVLTNGKKVRLLGINTPEVNFRKPGKSQPLAVQARQRLQEMLPDGSQVSLIFDQRRKDRYKRLLAFVRYLDKEGIEQDIGEQLLKQGLAWQYLILPNQLCWSDYRHAENKAYSQQKGVWDSANYQTGRAGLIRLTHKKREYKRVVGQITSIEHSEKNYWFILDEKLWIGIAKKDARHFGEGIGKIKNGSLIQVSGWLYQSYGNLRIKVRHPQAIRLVGNHSQ